MAYKSARSYYLETPDSESSSWIDAMVSAKRYTCTATISLACAVLSMPIKSILTYFHDSIYWPVIISLSFPGFTWGGFSKCTPTCPGRKQKSSNQGWYQRQASIYSKGWCWVAVTKHSWIGYPRAFHILWIEHAKMPLHQEGFRNFHLPCE